MGRPGKWQTNTLMQQIVAGNRDPQSLHWLDLQKAERYNWQRSNDRVYHRPLGVVESLFDADGSLWCGRADLHQNISFEIKTQLSDDQLRERLILAWTLMRHDQVLLSCTSEYPHEFTTGCRNVRWTDKCFVYRWPRSSNEALADTRLQVKFVADAYPDVNTKDFYHHTMNSARTLNAREALSKLCVMPFQRTSNDTIHLHFICVIAHQIVDGLTTFRWAGKIAEILNMDGNELDEMLDKLFVNEHELRARLPLAQEAFYPVRSQNKVRERWHWLLTRVLRHIRHPPPAAFQNPLRRQNPLVEARPLPPNYRDVLDYRQTPPLNSGRISGELYGRPVQNMRKLCKEAGFSIGSGLFTLVSMAMMEMEERRNPDVSMAQRLPFVGSFPVNPRPFLTGNSLNGSCMLAFSDGVTLPFLSHDLDFVGRFRLLGRLAHRQLRQYQKRKRSLEEEIHLGSRSPSQLIPALFCSTTERMENRADAEAKAGVNVQGSLPAKASPTLATCGISSVGDISVLMTPPKVDLNNLGGKDLVAEFKGISSLVRPRDGEFLVGAYGDSKHLSFGVSYDANAIDPAKAEEWKMVMESLLDRDLFAVTQAKL